MELKQRVVTLLKEMIAIDSETNTEKEVDMEKYLQHVLTSLGDPVKVSLIRVANDAQGRSVVCGFIPGKKKDTVIFINHHDVVGAESYGLFRDDAFSPDRLLSDLIEFETDETIVSELKSGEWIVGRGACDMKGGLAAQLAVFEAYAKHPGNASLLFVSLPDEESYSAGMRAAIPVLKEFRETYGLQYKILINSEPNPKKGNTICAYTGSVGKLLPVVLVQGKLAHVGQYQQGINPVGVLSRMIADTEGDMTLADRVGDAVTPPPAWMFARDRKTHYDVSLPERAAGCVNFMTYTKTPEDVMYILMDCARKAVNESLLHSRQGLSMDVLSSAELLKRAETYPGFDVFYENVKNNSFIRLQNGETTYVQETIGLIEAILGFTGMHDPMVIITFAPPYYPAADSLSLHDEQFKQILDTIHGIIDVSFEHYFNGVSDCSYCCPDPNLDESLVEANLPLWGKAYGMDFGAMEDMHIPFLLLGPWGKDLHERTERVNIESVSETLPKVLQSILAHVSDMAQ